jgi:preprotein translocase subunit SecE
VAGPAWSAFRSCGLALRASIMHLQACGGPQGLILGAAAIAFRRSVAQWLEHRSPKPGVGGSSPSTPARLGGLHWSGHVIYRGLRPTPLKAAAGIMAKINPFKFLQEVRAEAQKVTWPTRRETAITTAMVFVMVAVTSIFFLVADQIMRLVVTFLLGIGS